MNKNLPGLSPLWLISLSLVLGTVIVVLLPVAIATGDPIKASDWVGFAGSVVGGAMTVIAALVAWFAVQKQISAQQLIAERQMAIQAFDALVRHVEELRSEQVLQQNIRIICMHVGEIREEKLLSEIQTIRSFSDRVREQREELIKIHEILKETDARRWLLPENSRARLAVRSNVLDLIGQLTDFENKLKEISRLGANALIIARLVGERPNPQPLVVACENYSYPLRKAESKVMRKLVESKQAIGI